jgi:putative sterol carrier protein
METYAKFRRLTETTEADLDKTFQRLASFLGRSGKTATVQFTILVGNTPRSWTVRLQRREAKVQDEAEDKPDLEIITRDTTWIEIAEGRLSPLEAFRQGRLRARGDYALVSNMLMVAGDGSGPVAICGT